MLGRVSSGIVLALIVGVPVSCKSKPSAPAAHGIDPAGAADAAAVPRDGGTAPAAGSGAAATAGEAYPVDDLMKSIREGARSQLAGFIGVQRISDLTLYGIDVDVDPDRGTFRGKETLDFANRTGDQVSTMVLRVFGNMLGREGEPPPVRILSARVAGAPAEVRALGPTTFEVPLGVAVPAGGRVTMEIEFEGQAPEQEPGQTTMLSQGIDMLKGLFGMGGGGIEGYGILSMGDGILSLAAWYPVVSEYLADEHGFDRAEPSGIGDVGTSALANYRVTVRVAGAAVVASSGVLLDHQDRPDGLARTYGGAALRDFTLLVSRSYATETLRRGDVTITAFVPEGKREYAGRILDYASGALDVYERRFGQYTLTELDVAAAPLIGGAGGVEFPGIVTVATMLMQDLSESLGFLAPAGMDRVPMLDEMFEFVVVHETAHQWWNGLVGSDSIRHPFIDEALAQYSSILYFEDRYGAERAAKTGDLNVKLNFLVFRLLGNPDGPADRATSDFSGALEYAALVYGKAPYYFAAARRALGDEQFAEVMRRYYTLYRYKVAEPLAFAQVAGEVSGRPEEFAALHRHWLDEAHGDEDLGEASLGTLLEMVVGDAGAMGDLSSMLPGAGGGDAGGGLMERLLGSLLGGGQDEEADAGEGIPDPAEVAALLGQLGGATGDPNMQKLVDLVGRLARGEPVDMSDLGPALEVLLGVLADDPETAERVRELLPLLQMLLKAEEHSMTGTPMAPHPLGGADPGTGP